MRAVGQGQCGAARNNLKVDKDLIQVLQVVLQAPAEHLDTAAIEQLADSRRLFVQAQTGLQGVQEKLQRQGIVAVFFQATVELAQAVADPPFEIAQWLAQTTGQAAGIEHGLDLGIVHQVPLAKVGGRCAEWRAMAQALANAGGRIQVHGLAQVLTDTKEVDVGLLFLVAAGMDALFLQAFHQHIQHALQRRR